MNLFWTVDSTILAMWLGPCGPSEDLDYAIVKRWYGRRKGGQCTAAVTWQSILPSRVSLGCATLRRLPPHTP